MTRRRPISVRSVLFSLILASLLSSCSNSTPYATVTFDGTESKISLSREEAPIEEEIPGGKWECLEIRQGNQIPFRRCGVRNETYLVPLVSGAQQSDTSGTRMVLAAVVANEVTQVELLDTKIGSSSRLNPVKLSNSKDAVVAGSVECQGNSVDLCEIMVVVHAQSDTLTYEFDLSKPLGTLSPADEP